MRNKIVTTIYLTHHQAAEMDRLSNETGRSKADLIREGIDHVIADLGGTVEHEMAESRQTTSNPLSARVAALERRLALIEAHFPQENP